LIERAKAIRYDGRVEQGRTSPLRVHVETEDGVGADTILKATVHPHLEVEGLMNEMLGSLLAGDLDLPTPKPYFVELSPEFVESVADEDVRVRLGAASPLAFASTDAGSQWRRWATTDRLAPESRAMALQILAFDAFTGNPDRSPRNPNLLVNKAEPRMLLIDHECAFGIRMRLFPRLTPWIVGNLLALAARGSDSEHLFYAPLAGLPDLAFELVAERWNGLSDARFGAYDALLPDEWVAVRPALTEALDHFRQIRANMDGCLAELRRVLA